MLDKLMGTLPSFASLLFKGFHPNMWVALNHTEQKLLMLISNNEGKSMSEYSCMAGIKKSSFTMVTDKLVEKGLVKREWMPGDRRKTVLTLTDQGQEIKNTVHAQLSEQIDKRLSLLPEEDIRKLSDALTTIQEVTDKLRMKDLKNGR